MSEKKNITIPNLKAKCPKIDFKNKLSHITLVF